MAKAVQTIELSWVEAVAIVQAVCQQLELGRMPPAVGDLRLGSTGHVTFPSGGLLDEDVSIQLTARLLARLIGDSAWPLELCALLEKAQAAPMAFGSVKGFGRSLTCIPAGLGATLLASYVRRVMVALHDEA